MDRYIQHPYQRAIEDVGLLREIPTDESLLQKSNYALWLDAVNCIIRQEQGAGIPITDARINIREIASQAQPANAAYESCLYEVTWQIHPETPEGILLVEGEVLRDGWIVPAEPSYFMAEQREGIDGSVNGINITEETIITARKTASALETEYGTAEKLELYGDMFTAL